MYWLPKPLTAASLMRKSLSCLDSINPRKWTRLFCRPLLLLRKLLSALISATKFGCIPRDAACSDTLDAVVFLGRGFSVTRRRMYLYATQWRRSPRGSVDASRRAAIGYLLIGPSAAMLLLEFPEQDRGSEHGKPEQLPVSTWQARDTHSRAWRARKNHGLPPLINDSLEGATVGVLAHTSDVILFPCWPLQDAEQIVG